MYMYTGLQSRLHEEMNMKFWHVGHVKQNKSKHELSNELTYQKHLNNVKERDSCSEYYSRYSFTLRKHIAKDATRILSKLKYLFFDEYMFLISWDCFVRKTFSLWNEGEKSEDVEKTKFYRVRAYGRLGREKIAEKTSVWDIVVRFVSFKRIPGKVWKMRRNRMNEV